MRNDMPYEIAGIPDLLAPLFSHIDLLLLDRRFYSKELMMMLNERKTNYLIFVPKNSQIKEEFSPM